MAQQEVVTFRSSIHSSLKRYVLLRGTVIASIGVGFLLSTGIFFPIVMLGKWGFLIWMASLSFIALGLIPYRRLSRLETHPYELKIINSSLCVLSLKGKTILSFPLQAVSKMEYLSDHHLYGIGIWLYSSSTFSDLLKKPSRFSDCSLFLPYFSLNSFKQIKAIDSQEESDKS